MEKHAEILAPAGGEAQLRAAVLCGADAVYLGLRGFNARAGAENFDENTLPQTVGWCHARGVRVYATLNTLVTDRELPQWLHSLDAVAAAGVDGVLVQDLGLAKIIRQRYPTLPLHASTQMTIHNLAGARLLEEMGFAQVVLARELSKEEIAAICAGTSMRCEVFVHGALCMSVSGQCYLSSVLGERSGNRGRCAQPCRLDFKSHGRGYALSLKDLTLTDRLRELEALGVASFKIEGRLKRPEYVAAAVTACRQSLAGEVPDLETLQSVFSRSGFTDGYYTARRDLTMFGTRTREDAAAAAAVLGKLSALTRNEVGRLPVDMVLTMAPGEPATLAVTDGTHRVEVAGEVPQTALTRPTDEELARRALEKCGGTPFYLQNLTCHIGEGLMLPLSALNRLRAAALTALALIASYIAEIQVLKPDFNFNLTITNPPVLIGLFIGGVLPFLFAALTMDAVGRCAQKIVVEVRRQFREIKGLMTGEADPDYASCVDICTRSAQREMIAPAIVAVAAPIIVGLILGVNGVAGMLAGATVSGFILAVMMANSGGAWDNAKKYIESGEYGGKGSDNHKAAVVGDTVGDPFKDTSGPSINILIKLLSMVSIVFASVVLSFSLIK